MGRKLFEMSIKRQGHTTKIYIRSEVIPQIWKTWNEGESLPVRADSEGRSVYRFADGQRPPVGRWSSTDYDIFYSGHFNMSYLLLTELAEGITITTTQPMSRSALQDLAQRAKASIAEFLTEYGRPVDVSLTITEKDMANVE